MFFRGGILFTASKPARAALAAMRAYIRVVAAGSVLSCVTQALIDGQVLRQVETLSRAWRHHANQIDI